MKESSQLKTWETIGKWMLSTDENLQIAIQKATLENPWFTQHNIKNALHAIATDFLDYTKLQAFVNQYSNIPVSRSLKIGVISAGNVPLVGFHDLLCTLLCGHEIHLKLSTKDSVLMHALHEQLKVIDPKLASKIIFSEHLRHLDAYIATGSNNSVRYFESYFGKYPHIIRKNRQSVAIIDGQETDEELLWLGNDVFSYFGMGCRNVSQLLVPKNYDFNRILSIWQENYNSIIEHNAYRNNYDYNYAIYLLNKEPFLMNGCIILRESDTLASRIACLHYKSIQNQEELNNHLTSHKDNIQCIVSRNSIPDYKVYPLGKAQRPGLNDYADELDTMYFLSTLGHD